MAEQLFNAYNEQGPNPWKTWDGKDVPRWDAINDQVRAKWRAVADLAQIAVSLMKERKDEAYAERNNCVALIAHMAQKMGYRVGLAEHPASDTSWDPEWRNIVFIDLPTGQVSWHYQDGEGPLFNDLPKYDAPWDLHSTPEKYRRVFQAFR
jgi:hypothetical protein